MKKLLLGTIFLLSAACSKSVNDPVVTTCAVDEISSMGSCLKTDFRLNKRPMDPASSSKDKFVKTPDGTKVVYIADEDTLGKNELYVVDLEGGNKRKLNQPLIPDGDVISFVVSPNSQKVAFLTDANEDGKINLYTIGLDGTNLAQVNAGVPTTSHVVWDSYKFMPNSLKLVFVTDELGVAGSLGLFIADVDGTNRIALNTTSPGNGVVNWKFEISPSGRIVYPSRATGSANEWIMGSVLSDATGYRRLSALTGDVSRTVQQDAFLITPNGTKVVYLSTAISALRKELYSVDIDAIYPTSEVKISGTIQPNGNVDGYAGVMFQSTADSSKIIFAGDVDTDNIKELYSVAVGGGAVTKVSAALSLGSNVSGFKIASNSQDLLYVADADVVGVKELYHVNLLSMATKTKQNSALASGENIVDFDHDGLGRSVFIHNKGGNYNIYSKPYALSSELRLNSDTSTPVYDVISAKKHQFLVDSGKVFFRSSSPYALYKVNSDGTGLKQSHLKNHAGDVVIADSAEGTNFVLAGQYIVYRVIESGQKILYSSKH